MEMEPSLAKLQMISLLQGESSRWCSSDRSTTTSIHLHKHFISACQCYEDGFILWSWYMHLTNRSNFNPFPHLSSYSLFDPPPSPVVHLQVSCLLSFQYVCMDGCTNEHIDMVFNIRENTEYLIFCICLILLKMMVSNLVFLQMKKTAFSLAE